MTSAEFSRAECDQLLRSTIQTQFGITTERSYKADIQRIVSSTIQKYKNLRNPEEFRKFRTEYEKPFDMRLPRATPESLHRSVDDDVSDEAKKILQYSVLTTRNLGRVKLVVKLLLKVVSLQLLAHLFLLMLDESQS